MKETSLFVIVCIVFCGCVSLVSSSTAPSLTYWKQWSAKVNWTYVNDDSSESFYGEWYFDYVGNNIRIDFINSDDEPLPNGGSAQSTILQTNGFYYEITNGNKCSKSPASGSVDPGYPASWLGVTYVEYGIVPTTNRLGLHFSNVTIGDLWSNADVWVDAFTQHIIYVAPSVSQDLGFFTFSDFKGHLEDYNTLFALPQIIQNTCN